MYPYVHLKLLALAQNNGFTFQNLQVIFKEIIAETFNTQLWIVAKH